MNVEPFKTENEAEAEDYLRELLSRPEYRSIEEVERRAEKYVSDQRLRAHFIARAREIINGDGGL